MYTNKCAQGGTLIQEITTKSGKVLTVHSLCNGRTLCGCPGWSEKLTAFVERSLDTKEKLRYRYFTAIKDVARLEKQNSKYYWKVLAALTPEGEIAAVCWLGAGRVRVRDGKLKKTNVMEAAYVTAPEWERQGIARELTEIALELCKERFAGVELEATALRENRAMQIALRHMHEAKPGSTYRYVDDTVELHLPTRDETLYDVAGDFASCCIGTIGFLFALAPLGRYRDSLVRTQKALKA